MDIGDRRQLPIGMRVPRTRCDPHLRNSNLRAFQFRAGRADE